MIEHNTVNNHLHDWLSVAFTPQVGPATMIKLLHHFGTPQNILLQSCNTLAKFIPKTVAQLITNRNSEPLVKQSMFWLEQSNTHHIITINDNYYPAMLKQITNPPLVLFAKGRLELLKNNMFAIIGSRNATTQGCNDAYRFSYQLSGLGLTIVSGLAVGIDSNAHLGAIKERASTIAVLGTGIDQVYPAKNKELFLNVANSGLLLSEFPLGTQAIATNFPMRNRIVAGLSLGCLIIESAIDGGSLITANLALDMGREVMAIPGSIHNPLSRGCHKLIKNGAKLVETINDIIEELNLVRLTTPSNNSVNNKETSPILKIMGYDAIEIDTICSGINMSFADACAQLLQLELEGQIINCGNGKYQRIFR